jgi:hypothetical protein
MICATRGGKIECGKAHFAALAASLQLIEDVIGFRGDLQLITAIDALQGIALAISHPRLLAAAGQ